MFLWNVGCFKYASGSSYDGQWENNIYMGFGTYTVWFIFKILNAVCK